MLAVQHGYGGFYAGGRRVGENGMIVEWKRLRVRPELRARFVAVDEQVWTAGLARQAGFLGKEVWLDREDPAGVALAIRWRSPGDLRGVAPERLEELARSFAGALPEGVEELETVVYEIAERP
jgi:uncharacterized protein (TIGR03792 family)